MQALFNGYYHDDNIAAINAKNPPPRMIEEHIPSGALSPSTNNTTSLAQSVAPAQSANMEASVNNSIVNTL